MTQSVNAIRRGFMLTLGPINVPTRLQAVIPSEKDEVRTLCKEHLVPVNQRYTCPTDQKVDPETIKGLVLGRDTYRVYEDGDKPFVPSDPGLDFSAVPLDQFLGACLPLKDNYYVTPEATGQMAWEVLYKLAEDPKRALVAKGAIRENSVKIYRLVTFNGFLVLRSYEYPEYVREAPVRPAVRVPREMLTLARQFVTSIESSWDAFDAKDTNRAEFRQFVEKNGKPVSSTVTTETITPPTDIMDALKKSVALTKKKKPTKRKAS